MNDDRIRDLYQAGVQPALSGRTGCPTPEELQALVERGGEEADRLARLDHVMACSDCKRDFDLLRTIADAERSSVPRRSKVPMALAASVAALLAVGTVLQFGSGSDPVFRGGPNDGLRVVAPLGAVASPDRIVWTRLDPEARYDVEILDVSGAVVFAAAVADTVLILPRTLVLLEGEPYRVLVRASSVSSGEVSAPVVEFRVR